MKVIGFVLRWYSYLFHIAVSCFCLGLGIVSLATATQLHIEAIGIGPNHALAGIFLLGGIGLVATVLAMTGVSRLLFPVWGAAVVWLMVKLFFLSSVTFSGPQSFRVAVLLTAGALLAFIGAVCVVKAGRRR